MNKQRAGYGAEKCSSLQKIHINILVRITELVCLVLVGFTAGHKASDLADENLV